MLIQNHIDGLVIILIMYDMWYASLLFVYYLFIDDILLQIKIRHTLLRLLCKRNEFFNIT